MLYFASFAFSGLCLVCHPHTGKRWTFRQCRQLLKTMIWAVSTLSTALNNLQLNTQSWILLRGWKDKSKTVHDQRKSTYATAKTPTHDIEHQERDSTIILEIHPTQALTNTQCDVCTNQKERFSITQKQVSKNEFISAARIVSFSFRIKSLSSVSKVTSSKYLLNTFNGFYGTALLWFLL